MALLGVLEGNRQNCVISYMLISGYPFAGVDDRSRFF